MFKPYFLQTNVSIFLKQIALPVHYRSGRGFFFVNLIVLSILKTEKGLENIQTLFSFFLQFTDVTAV